jgi:hypothetical protein
MDERIEMATDDETTLTVTGYTVLHAPREARVNRSGECIGISLHSTGVAFADVDEGADVVIEDEDGDIVGRSSSTMCRSASDTPSRSPICDPNESGSRRCAQRYRSRSTLRRQ